ncbi:U4/U6-U5 snRNP complex subunit LSM6 [Cyberlindnera jadinii NRRL Y-1542]|uniref:Sm-like ribonucleo protein n=1 Tax=Cyberlindnera jadinii (strain ATCC 18201 / CBS 1600 / BCRC 20928 / JCM 3617 / NBRC 0987 / NRRL Y-1542) TaxID=983966 RepID=A0A1E4S9J8_CYBJN|nr:Sm-like ribonucleo protein [Cyberlindnera jadinii NRRL Y-1542]ODV76163.1 Sm-like ribonucleo protein [Cyberlindnera jadinii NRRL Y-1542]
MSEAGEEQAVSAPSQFLSEITGSKVIVKLYSGEEYHGNLDSIDGYMNVALEEAEEYVGGQITNKYGDVFIRANNVLYISQE